MCRRPCSGMSDFNPRFREGSDDIAPMICLELHEFQSTLPRRKRHAARHILPDTAQFQSTLPRRKRRETLYQDSDIRLFQSTLPRRKRQHIHISRQLKHRFQSTLPRRKRRHQSACRRQTSDFNPRFREGSDVPVCRIVHPVKKISIHASAKEATAVAEVMEDDSVISIHASAKEATNNSGGGRQQV